MQRTGPRDFRAFPQYLIRKPESLSFAKQISVLRIRFRWARGNIGSAGQDNARKIVLTSNGHGLARGKRMQTDPSRVPRIDKRTLTKIAVVIRDTRLPRTVIPIGIPELLGGIGRETGCAHRQNQPNQKTTNELEHIGSFEFRSAAKSYGYEQRTKNDTTTRASRGSACRRAPMRIRSIAGMSRRTVFVGMTE